MQTPEQLADKLISIYQTSYARAHNTEGRGVIESNKMALEAVEVFLTARDAEIRAETLAQAAALCEKRRLKVLNDSSDPSWTEHFSELQLAILGLVPDPHQRERIELEARIAEVEAWDSATTTSEHWNYSQSARKQWRDEHISILKFKLAALDAQSVANLPIDRGYCGRCGNSIPECKCVPDAPKGEVK